MVESGDFSEFKCRWKEGSIAGNDKFFNVTLRFYHDSGRTAIKFDGLNAKWEYSALEGDYGPVTRYDLFIGATVKLFGRRLTIRTTTADTCHWMDQEAAFMEQQKLWLQEKISKSGNQPIIKREPHQQIQHVERISVTTGTRNLRKIHTQICKLKEQLCDVGLGHLLPMLPQHKESSSKSLHH